MLQSVQKSTGKAKKSENKKVANSLVSRRMRASKPASKRRGRDSEGRRPRSRSKGQMRASSRTSSRNRQMAKMELGMLYDRTSSENDAYALLKKELLANEELNPGSMYAPISILLWHSFCGAIDTHIREHARVFTLLLFAMVTLAPSLGYWLLQ